MQILLCCFQQFAVVALALRAAPFGIPATAFWVYVCASLLFVIGFIKILNELPQEHGIDKSATEHGHLTVTNLSMVSNSCSQ